MSCETGSSFASDVPGMPAATAHTHAAHIANRIFISTLLLHAPPHNSVQDGARARHAPPRRAHSGGVGMPAQRQGCRTC
ncbi:hypothetical protein PSP6_30061 [Paraburkholderia tropica]|nr:hypothetical protein PSP6_30061 [Paraburkholderia tropica]